MVIGHDATRGLVTFSLPESTGSGSSALRQVALNAFTSPAEWADIADDFFPAEPRTFPDLAREKNMSTANMARWAHFHQIPLRPPGGASHDSAQRITD